MRLTIPQNTSVTMLRRHTVRLLTTDPGQTDTGARCVGVERSRRVPFCHGPRGVLTTKATRMGWEGARAWVRRGRRTVRHVRHPVGVFRPPANKNRATRLSTRGEVTPRGRP